MQRDNPLKTFLKTLHLFSQLEFIENGGNFFGQSWIGHVMRLKGLISFSLSFSLKLHAEKTDSGFPETFLGEYLFVYVKYLCNRSSKMKTKTFKNCILILAVVNYQNWLEASLL